MTSRKILRARKSEMNTRKGSHRKRLPERPIFELTLLERRVLLSAITNYNYSFETGTSTTGWSVPIEVDTSNAITGWGSTDYLKGPATLTLNSLPAHTGAVVSFDIYALDEWDGNNSPSAFTLKANGATVVSTNFANTWATGTVTNNDPNPPTTEIDSTCYTQSYPAANGDATLAPQSGAVAVGDMDSDGELLTDYSCTSCDCGGGCCGCGCCGGGGTVTWTVTPIYGGNISDAVYQFTVPIDDSSSTLALDFGGSFPVGAAMGIDNVNVTLAQPEIAGINSDGNGVDLFSGTISNSVDGPSLDDIDMDMGSTISADGGDIADILFTGLGGSSSLGNGDANLAAAGDNGSGTASGNVSELLQSGDNTIALLTVAQRSISS